MHLRQPAVAGRFYTDVPADLRAEVESFLKQGAALPASALAAGDAAHLAGLMLPHAGHVYSGRVIGATLAHVRLPRTVFLLCPNHTGLGTPLSVWPAGACGGIVAGARTDGPAPDLASHALARYGPIKHPPLQIMKKDALRASFLFACLSFQTFVFQRPAGR